MPRQIAALAVLIIALLLPLSAGAQEIKGPVVKINDGHIIVTTDLALSDKQVEAISKGISKEIDIYVDLFRVWKGWPDEFVLGDKFVRTLSCDPVKNEFVATSLHGDTLREKRFSDCDSLLKWALSVKDLTLTSTTELEAAEYFVKITAESRLKKVPPVVSYLFFFVKDKEFKITKDSKTFPVNIAPETPGKKEPAK